MNRVDFKQFIFLAHSPTKSGLPLIESIQLNNVTFRMQFFFLQHTLKSKMLYFYLKYQGVIANFKRLMHPLYSLV